MTSVSLEALLRRDRTIVAATLTLVTALAWVYLLILARQITSPGMSMPDMPNMTMAEPALRPWSAADFGVTFAMWAVMMIGMMIPSAATMILLYARVARQAAQQGRPLAATGWFAAGYILSWTAFSVVATVAQGLLQRAALLTPALAASTNRVGGVILIAAGIYQWTVLKNACLTHCRGPLEFVQAHGGFKKTVAGSLGMGFHHGLYCVGCCWVLMVLLFAGGVMNILWIAAIAAFVLMEKVLPGGYVISRLAGVGFVAAGLWLIL